MSDVNTSVDRVKISKYVKLLSKITTFLTHTRTHSVGISLSLYSSTKI